MAVFEKSQQIVGTSEGGYQNNPQDSGNYYMGNLIGTNWGISAPVLASYLGRIPTKSEMQNLSRKTAEQILKLNYWLKNHFEKLQNQSVATLLYDGAVNHGNSGMRSIMLKVLRSFNISMSDYQVFSLKGISSLNRLNQRHLFNAIKSERTERYKKSENKQFLTSWMNRLERIQFYSNNSIAGIWPYAALVCVGIGLILITL